MDLRLPVVLLLGAAACWAGACGGSDGTTGGSSGDAGSGSSSSGASGASSSGSSSDGGSSSSGGIGPDGGRSANDGGLRDDAGPPAEGGAGAFFFDDFAGTSLGSAWTVIERRGPAGQDENECNTKGAVGVSGGFLNVTTSATPATCGDAVTAPTQLPYTSGDLQWANLSFTYGTVEVRAKLPPQSTGTWPAIWLLGANCQAANLVNGSESSAYDGCPAQGDPAYQEIDMVECDARSWCHLVVAQGSAGWSSMCAFQVDANWHVFALTWDATKVSLAVDGTSTGCSFPNTSLHGPMFLILQTQTTTASGVAGLPNNANLPTSFQIDYAKVTQPRGVGSGGLGGVAPCEGFVGRSRSPGASLHAGA